MKQVEERSHFFDSIKNVWLDPRIPTRDRWVICISFFLIISPFDIVPDFIPFVGFLDDLVIASFIADYFFNRLDENIILDHFNGGRKRFMTLKAFIGRVCKISPQHLLHFLWKYKKPKSYNSRQNPSVKSVN